MFFRRLRPWSSLLLWSGVLCAGLSSCVVPQARYDGLQAAHDAQQKQNVKLTQQLSALNAQLVETQGTVAKLEARLADQAQELSRHEESLASSNATRAEAEYQSSVSQTERKAAEDLVTQLRQELARLASHVATLSEAKEKLGAEHASMTTELTTLRAQVTDLQTQSQYALAYAQFVKELTAPLAEPYLAKKLLIDLDPKAVVLRLPERSLFEPGGKALTKEGKQLLAQVAGSLRSKGTQVQITEWAPARTKADRKLHIRQVAGELHAAGLELEQLGMIDTVGSEPDAVARKATSPEVWLRVWKNSSARSQQPAAPQKALLSDLAR